MTAKSVAHQNDLLIIQPASGFIVIIRPMGFPDWTLWGMGVASAAALLFVVLAYLAQSPRQIARYRWLAFRLANRGRALTGYGLASLLVALGFFLAGIPIGPTDGGDPAAENTPVELVAVTPEESDSVEVSDASTADQPEKTDPDQDPEFEPDLTPESGAFLRPPTAAPEELISEENNNSEEEGVQTEGESAAPTATSQAPDVTLSSTPLPSATPSPTPSATPTVTPTPTITPTPILGITAQVETLSSTLWVRRTPGGAQFELVLNGDTLVVEESRVSVGGVLWQQVRTLNGNLGWVQAEFLSSPAGENQQP